jgi:hypothetical protein
MKTRNLFFLASCPERRPQRFGGGNREAKAGAFANPKTDESRVKFKPARNELAMNELHVLHWQNEYGATCYNQGNKADTFSV